MSLCQSPVLNRIVEAKRKEAARLKQYPGAPQLQRQAQAAPAPRNFLGALKQSAGAAVIAEIKRRSPSAGVLTDSVDVSQRALMYQAGGAAAISVLTEVSHFRGSLTDLGQAKAAAGLPILRKDFIVDQVQIFQSRAAGADAVLLIAAILQRQQLRDLYQACTSLGMDALIEVHEPAELDRVLPLDPPLVGINNRNLKTLEVDIGICRSLRPLIPPSVTVVAESGVSSPEDVAVLKKAGLDAFLVGTALMRSNNPQAMVRSLVADGGG
ncbi:MAG: indole-3-glycerol phosphate synthase TrpC [Desulfarculaceae bacterium]|jgi:indole-3-glycerol phosphate synthase